MKLQTTLLAATLAAGVAHAQITSTSKTSIAPASTPTRIPDPRLELRQADEQPSSKTKTRRGTRTKTDEAGSDGSQTDTSSPTGIRGQGGAASATSSPRAGAGPAASGKLGPGAIAGIVLGSIAIVAVVAVVAAFFFRRWRKAKAAKHAPAFAQSPSDGFSHFASPPPGGPVNMAEAGILGVPGTSPSPGSGVVGSLNGYSVSSDGSTLMPPPQQGAALLDGQPKVELEAVDKPVEMGPVQERPVPRAELPG